MPQCGEFFIAKEDFMIDEKDKQLRIELKTALVQALINTKKIRLGHRPSSVKFDETVPIFLASLNQIHNFSIGDTISLGDTNYDWLTEGNWIIPSNGEPYFLARHAGPFLCGFFELNGHIINSQIKISDIFCALAVRLKDIIRILKVSDENSPVLLFWVEGLKLVRVPVKI